MSWLGKQIEELNTPYYREKLAWGVPSGYILTIGLAVLALLFGHVGLLENVWSMVLILAPIKLFTNTLMWWSLRKDRFVLSVAVLNQIADVGLITGMIYFTGGPTSPVISVYYVVLALIAMLTNVGATILTGALMLVAYSTMLLLIHSGVLKFYPTFLQTVYEEGEFTWFFVVIDILKVGFLLAVMVVASSAILKKVQEQQEALQLKNRELEEANQLKSQFVANITHELRTPIHGVLGLTEMLDDEIYGSVNQRQKKALDGIKTSAEGLLHMVDDLLSLERVNSGHLSMRISVVPLQKLIEELMAFGLGIRGKRDISIEAHCPPSLVLMATDKSLLHHILTNLLANALKFTPDGGKVVIRVEREGTFAKISVSDTGIGIPQEKIHTIWEPFRQIDGTASRSYGGAGLGLAVVARLAKLLKADVSVSSKVGVGTTFCVTLDGCTVSD